MPKRIQRKRTKGWRKPDNTVIVSRPSRWGNPFKVGDPHPVTGEPLQPGEAVVLYRRWLMPYSHVDGTIVDFMASELSIKDIQEALRGKDLACFCSLDNPCHADVLLEIANGSV